MNPQPQPGLDPRWHGMLLALAALLATAPLIVHGCSCGHDFDFHLLNWMEAASQFRHGTLHPQWVYTAAYNAGEPRFVFYPPLSWTIGGILGLILTHLPGLPEALAWSAAPILFTWLALTAAALALYRLAREFVPATSALLAATLYLANPYMLFTAYERTAYAELLAAAWIPLLLIGILRARVTVAGIAVPLALLWLTNAPAAVMGSYALAFLVCGRIAQALRRSPPPHAANAPQLAWKSAAGTLLGFALAGFYIIPAAYERRFVRITMVIIPGLRIQDNVLFHHTTGPDAALHDVVLRTVSIVAIVLLTATLLAGTAARLRTRVPTGTPLRLLVGLVAVIAFLLTPWSLFLWNHAPQAAFLQFPWRLLAILAAVCALTAAFALGRIHLRPAWAAAAALALAAALSLPAYRVFAQRCYAEDTPASRLALFHTTGSDPTDEYTPAAADNDELQLTDPPYWLALKPDAPAPLAPNGAAPHHLTVTADKPGFLILNLRSYPSWRIRLNGVPDLQRLARPDGLVALAVPAGTSTVDIAYASLTPDAAVGGSVTVLALIALPFTLRRSRSRNQRSGPSSASGIATAAPTSDSNLPDGAE